MEDIHPLKAPIDIAFFSSLELFVLGVLLVMSVWFVMNMIFRNRIKKKAAAGEKSKTIPTKTLQEQYRERLGELEYLIAKKDYKLFSLQLSQVMKDYWEKRSGENFCDWTTDQIKTFFADHPKKKDIVKFLHETDRVKFAGAKLTAAQAKALHHLAHSLL